MSAGGFWIQEAKARPVSAVAASLGMDVRRDRLGPCPACGDLREKGVRRLPVGLFRGDDGWICNRCHLSGDVLDLVSWKILGKPCKNLDSEGWQTLRGWFGGVVATLPRLPQGPAPEPDYPPHSAIQHIWDQFLQLPPDGRAEGESAPVVQWLRKRGLDPELVAALDLIRVAPAQRSQRPPEGAPRQILMPGYPWVAALPLVDATGLLRSLVFRAVDGNQHPKSYGLVGYERRGLVLADPVAQALLARQEETVRPISLGEGGPAATWDGRVLLVEGEPDFLTVASYPQRIGASLKTPAIVGWLGSTGLPEEVARRIPASARVIVYPHVDPNGAGEKAALRTRERLSHVADIRKGKV